MSRRSKGLHNAWELATLLKENQLVRWTDLDVPEDGDYGDIIDRPCLVEVVDDWDGKKYTSVSHHFATVANVQNHSTPHLQFYNQIGDKDEKLIEKSIADIYLFPAPGSTITLADESQYTLQEVILGSLSFEICKIEDASSAKKKDTKANAKKQKRKIKSVAKLDNAKKKKTGKAKAKAQAADGLAHVQQKKLLLNMYSVCAGKGKKAEAKTATTIKTKKKDLDGGSSSCVEGSAEFTLDAVLRSFENPRGEYRI